MPLEAIEKISQFETESKKRKEAAQAKAKQMIAEAEQAGLARLQKVRTDAAESGRKMLVQAEARAADRAKEIASSAEAEGTSLRAAAGNHLNEAAEFIVGRVVNT